MKKILRYLLLIAVFLIIEPVPAQTRPDDLGIITEDTAGTLRLAPGESSSLRILVSESTSIFIRTETFNGVINWDLNEGEPNTIELVTEYVLNSGRDFKFRLYQTASAGMHTVTFQNPNVDEPVQFVIGVFLRPTLTEATPLEFEHLDRNILKTEYNNTNNREDTVESRYSFSLNQDKSIYFHHRGTAVWKIEDANGDVIYSDASGENRQVLDLVAGQYFIHLVHERFARYSFTIWTLENSVIPLDLSNATSDAMLQLEGQLYHPTDMVTYQFEVAADDVIEFRNLSRGDAYGVTIHDPSGEVIASTVDRSLGSHMQFRILEDGVYSVVITPNADPSPGFRIVDGYRFALATILASAFIPIDLTSEPQTIESAEGANLFALDLEAGAAFYASIEREGGSYWIFPPDSLRHESVAYGTPFDANTTGRYYLMMVIASEPFDIYSVPVHPAQTISPPQYDVDVEPLVVEGELFVPGERHIYRFEATSPELIIEYLNNRQRVSPPTVVSASGESVEITRLAGSNRNTRFVLKDEYQTQHYPLVVGETYDLIFSFVPPNYPEQQGYSYQVALYNAAPMNHTYNIDVTPLSLRDNPPQHRILVASQDEVVNYRFNAAPGQSMAIEFIEQVRRVGVVCTLTDPNEEIVAQYINEPPAISFQSDEGGTMTLACQGEGTLAFMLYELETVQNEFNIEFNTIIYPDYPAVGAGRLEFPGNVDSYYFNVDRTTDILVLVLDRDRSIGIGFGPTGFGPTPAAERGEGVYAFTLRRQAYTYWVSFGSPYMNATGEYRFAVYTRDIDASFDIEYGQVVEPNVPAPGAGVLERPYLADEYPIELNEGETIYVEALYGLDYPDFLYSPNAFFDLKLPGGAGDGQPRMGEYLHDEESGRFIISYTARESGTHVLEVIGYQVYNHFYSFRVTQSPPE